MMRRLLYVTTGVYWCMMCILTHLPPRNAPRIGLSEKLAHLLAFMLLGALLYLCLRPAVRRAMLLVAVVGATYGAVDEWTQPLVGRSCEWLDWACDLTGVVLGASTGAVLLRRARSPGLASIF